ncbi:nucleotidyltransferase family protein [Methylocystis sp. JAN1]|uniref:nucleotidyltransferase family protein n=1 Tax=Methylocystis sp. JAN1 TaxID=3397211 RepID=UPI003FA26D57
MSMAVAAIILAGGRGVRFGGRENKLLAAIDGEPVLRRVAWAALASRAAPPVVVTGHARNDIEAALADLPVRLTHNPLFASGLASSLRAGLAAAADVDAAVILLGDMPGVSPRIVDALIEAFEAAPQGAAVVPTCHGRRGNPVLLPRAIFPQVALLEGDEGARKLLRARQNVVELPLDDDRVLADVDAPADLARFKRS